MVENNVLREHTRRLDSVELGQMLVQDYSPPADSSIVFRPDKSTIDLASFDALMAEVTTRQKSAAWQADRATSDRWIAPRLHWALRLTRSEASSRGIWQWLAGRATDYVAWRWSGERGIADDRWWGSINKQALARLWWGAELFRDGADYSPVTRAFVRQDLPNSFLHRPLIRCRSLALGLLEVAAPADNVKAMSADDVNDLAGVLNLATAGAPPELETDFQRDDLAGYRVWVTNTVPVVSNWDSLPVGPPCSDTTANSLAGGKSIAERGWSFAYKAAENRGSRSSRRRQSRSTADPIK